MLKEKEALGTAILEALKMNGYSKADAARKFNVRPPSITGWIQTGRISKSNFDELRRWLTKTPENHWSVSGAGTKKLPVHESADFTNQERELLNAFRLLDKATKDVIVSLVLAKSQSEKNLPSHPVSKKPRKAA